MMKFLVSTSIVFALLPRTAGKTDACTKDNWGLTQEDPIPPYDVHGFNEISTCDFLYSDFSEQTKPVAIFYESGHHFEEFFGVDLVPDKHSELQHLWQENVQKWEPGNNGPKAMNHKASDHTVQFGECTLPQDDGGAWIVQRVGPFTSTGGYDFWQLGWDDAYKLSDVLREHPEGVKFTSALSGAIEDETGKLLNYPPIHIHHIHIGPNKGKAKNPGSYTPIVAIEQHGDYECNDGDGGTDCLVEKTPVGYAKEAHTTFELEGELNDVRAPNSKPKKWWYQIAIRWHPKTVPLKTLSQHFFTAYGMQNTSNQLATLMPYYLQTDESQIFWYSGRMERDGEMVRNKLHTHNAMFQNAFWFRASPEELGLVGGEHDVSIERQSFGQNSRGDPVSQPEAKKLSETGFKSFAELQGYMLDNLVAAEKRAASNCSADDQGCKEGLPALVCQAEVNNAEVYDDVTGRSYTYDRRAKSCCRDWRYRAGDIFTTVAFTSPLKGPPGPWTGGMVPKKFPMHLHWVMTSRELPVQDWSIYDVSGHTQSPDVQLQGPHAHPQGGEDAYHLQGVEKDAPPAALDQTEVTETSPSEATVATSFLSLSVTKSHVAQPGMQPAMLRMVGGMVGLLLAAGAAVANQRRKASTRCLPKWCVVAPPYIPRLCTKTVQRRE